MEGKTVRQDASALSVEQIIDALRNQIILGLTHLRIGSGLQKADPVVLQTAHVFFGFTITAHMQAAQMIAARLFDKTGGTVNLRLLLRRLKTNPGPLQNGTSAELRQAIADAAKKLPILDASLHSITKRRNKWLAHTAPQTVANPGLLAQEAPITADELELTFKVAGEILNSITNIKAGATSWFDLVDENDFEWVCKLVADAKCAQVRAYEAEFGAPAPFPRPRDCK